MSTSDGPAPLIDPVCGRELAPDAERLGVTYRGRRWFFCDDPERGCRRAFKREPERWADARPEAGVALHPPVPPPSRGPSPFNVVTGPAPRIELQLYRDVLAAKGEAPED